MFIVELFVACLATSYDTKMHINGQSLAYYPTYITFAFLVVDDRW